jgi:hypothetical protein
MNARGNARIWVHNHQPPKETDMEVKKLSLAEALAKSEAERHNSAIGNVVCVLNGIGDKRRLLKAALDQCDADEADVNALAAKTDADPATVNDDPALHQLFMHYGSFRGHKGYLRGNGQGACESPFR